MFLDHSVVVCLGVSVFCVGRAGSHALAQSVAVCFVVSEDCAEGRAGSQASSRLEEMLWGAAGEDVDFCS